MQLAYTGILNTATMDEDERYFITKRFYFLLEASDYITGSDGKKRASDLVPITARNTAGFPLSGVALSENAQYIMTGTVGCGFTNTLGGGNNADPFSINSNSPHWYYVDAKYRFSTKSDANLDQNGDAITSDTSPWLLPIQDFNTTYPDSTIPFEYAYTNKMERTKRVANTAGSQIISDTTDHIMEFSFTYNVKSMNRVTAFNLANSVNLNAIKIAGMTFSSGQLYMRPMTIKYNKTFSNTGAVKWEYDSVSVRFQYKKEGWKRVFLNVGTEAFFHGSKQAEQIFMWRENQDTTATGTIQYTNFNDVIVEKTRLAALGKDMAYESASEPLPLTIDGLVDVDAINTPYDSEGNSNYVKATYYEFPFLSWTALNIPRER